MQCMLLSNQVPGLLILTATRTLNAMHAAQQTASGLLILTT